MTNKEISISFDFIKEHCKTIADVIKIAPNNKPSYIKVMKESDIPIITGEKSLICNSNPINKQKDKKTGIKIQALKGLSFEKHFSYFLRYQDDFFYISIMRNLGLLDTNANLQRKKGVTNSIENNEFQRFHREVRSDRF